MALADYETCVLKINCLGSEGYFEEMSIKKQYRALKYYDYQIQYYKMSGIIIMIIR